MNIDIPFILSSSQSPSPLAKKLIGSSHTVFSIGTVVFAIDEAPDELELPATQNLAVKDLIGGKRVIQGLGTVWKPITWEGYFWGANAQYKARQLMRMQAEASVQRLKYLSFALDVVIEQFFPSFLHQNQCKYKITVQVLNDASGAVSKASTTSVDAQIQSCVASANKNLQDVVSGDNADDPTDAELQAAHQKATSALDSAGPAAQATGSSVTTTLTSIQNVISVGQKYLSLLPAGKVTPKFLSLSRYVNNWTVVYKNFNTVQNHQQVTMNGGSLFEVASKYYGDPSKAIAIQQQNGLASTDLPSGVLSTIVLPPIATS